MKRILITGSQGALGTYLKRSLLQRNAADELEIFCVTRNPPKPPFLESGVNFVEADFLDELRMNAVLDDIRPDTAFHLAWETTHGDYWTSSSNQDWANASIRLAEQFKEIGGNQFVFAGTCAEYQWGEEILDETSTPELPATLYGREKLRVTQKLVQLNSRSETNFATGRIFFPYSELENEYRITSVLVRKILAGQNLDLRAGDVYRSICHTKHIAQAMINMAEGSASGVFNLVPQHLSHLGQFLKHIAQYMDQPDLLSWQDWSETAALTTEPRHLCADGMLAAQYFPNTKSANEDIAQFVDASVERFSSR